ncbi:hypothetical protein SUGI_0372950 [Cryptomeria japonica]|nr:hypothetical protein SUGI_0372950 [Cryptomeria japonica]
MVITPILITWSAAEKPQYSSSSFGFSSSSIAEALIGWEEFSLRRMLIRSVHWVGSISSSSPSPPTSLN